jgi:Methyltransferase domain
MRWQDIGGWLSEPEGAKLAALASGKLVLELGAYKGRSTVAMAATARLIVSCDSHSGDSFTGAAQTAGEFLGNTRHLSNVIPVVGRFENILPLLQPVFGLVFIDGSHTRRDVIRDTKHAMGCLDRNHGILAYHDWNMRAVRSGALSAGFVLDDDIESLAWGTAACGA